MNVRTKLMIAALVIGLAALSTVQAQGKKIKREELPPAVEKTVAAESKGATIGAFSTEVEDGKRLYGVELMVNGHGRTIGIDEQGNIVEEEKDVALDSLPAEVKLGLKKAAGRGRISKVVSLTKQGRLVAYEAVIKTGAKRHEIQVGPNGKKLAHPE